MHSQVHPHHTGRDRALAGKMRRQSLRESFPTRHDSEHDAETNDAATHLPTTKPLATVLSRKGLGSTLDALKTSLSTAEFATITMLALYALLGIVYSAQVPHGITLAAVDFGLISVMSILAMNDTHYAHVQPSESVNAPRFLAPARRLLLFPTLLIVYMQAPLYVPFVHPHDYDTLLAALDKTLFGVSPTVWLYAYSHPIVTEILQACYLLFFIIPLCLGIEFHRTKSDAVFRKYTAQFMIALYGSYLLYFCLPAIGPCFTVHDFARTNTELPGVFFTETIRMIINNGSGAGTALPHLTAHRNCMPSGHTIAAVVNIVCAFRFRSRYRWLVASICAGILVSTVYLRYHHAVDVLAGLVLAPLFMLGIRSIQGFMRSRGFVSA